MVRYLLDTPAMSDLVRNPQGRTARKIAEVGEAAIGTSIIVSADLRFGAEKKGSARLTTQVHAILAAIEVLPFEAPAEETYARLRSALEAAGPPIGANDLLIASHALTLGMTLVTDNVREFRRVKGLKVENWVR